MTSAAQRLEEILSDLSPDESRKLDRLLASELAKPWIPSAGPQTAAFLSKADLLLFGGAAGGGKSDLICGLSISEHERTVVFRKQSSDLTAFWERLLTLAANPAPKSKNVNLKRLTTYDDRLVECGHIDAPDSERSWAGRPHDLIAFDEGAQLDPHKIIFVMGWLRTSKPGQRCRAIIASNPPVGGEGAYLLEWFAPWLDPFFANPAEHGELRWAISVGDRQEIKTIWVDGPEPIWLNPDKTWRLATAEEIAKRPHLDQVNKPLSRTFIPSRLDDNPYYRDSGYRARLNNLPEPLRSQLLHGDFLTGREDDEWQVIPSSWVREAQNRWADASKEMAKPSAGKRQLSLGVDVSQGGADKTSIAPLYASNDIFFFDRVKSWPGRETPDGPSVANLILSNRRDNASIGIDMTGGWGGSARDYLANNHQIKVVGIVFSSGATGGDPLTHLGFANLRAKMYWQFRNALDPSKSGAPGHRDVALPPGDRVMAQLTAARWYPRSGKIVIEAKDEIRTRLGSSPDEADAIVEAWYVRDMKTKALSEGSSNHRSLGEFNSRSARLSWMG